MTGYCPYYNGSVLSLERWSMHKFWLWRSAFHHPPNKATIATKAFVTHEERMPLEHLSWSSLIGFLVQGNLISEVRMIIEKISHLGAGWLSLAAWDVATFWDADDVTLDPAVVDDESVDSPLGELRSWPSLMLIANSARALASGMRPSGKWKAEALAKNVN